MEPKYTKIDEGTVEVSEPQTIKISDIVDQRAEATGQLAELHETYTAAETRHDQEKADELAQIQTEIDRYIAQITSCNDQLQKAADAGVDDAIAALS